MRDASRTDGEGGKRGQMCVLARGKPPGSGQSLPNKQSHSDERLIAIVFLFSKGPYSPSAAAVWHRLALSGCCAAAFVMLVPPD